MRFKNREKIVVGSILGLATIGALHYFIFKPRADHLASARDQYENQKKQIEQLGQPKSLEEIYQFKYENTKYILQFYNLVKELNISLPAYYAAEQDVERQHKDLLDALDQLLEFRDTVPKPKLSFLDENHWAIPQKLPDEVTEAGVDLGDKIRRVVEANEVIKVLPEGSPLRMQQEAQYRQLLRGIGVDLDKANNVIPQFGSVVTTFYLLMRADLIRQALPADFKIKTPLEELYRLKWPDDMLFRVRQMQAFLDILRMAKDAEVEEIASVTLGDVYLIHPKPTEEEEAAEGDATAAGGMGAGTMMDPSMMGMFDPAMMDPAMMGMGGGMGMGGMGMGGMGMGGMGMGMGAAPVEEIAILGAVGPIEMEVVGPNLNVMKFLYAVTHSKKSYGISYIAIKSVEEPSGWVRAITKVQVATIAGTKNFTPEEIENKIIEWETVQKELLERPGVQAGASTLPRPPSPATAPAPPPAPASPDAPLNETPML